MEKAFFTWDTTPQKLDVSPSGWVKLSQTGYGSVHLPWMKYRTPQTGHNLLQMGYSFIQLPSKAMQLTPEGTWLPRVVHNSPQGVLPFQVWSQHSRMGQGPQEHIEPRPDGLQLSERERAPQK